MIRKLSCLLVLAATATACGTDLDNAGDPADPAVNALEASGKVEFFVKLVSANGTPFRGETTNSRFLGSSPAIRFYSDVNRSTTTGTHCTEFTFTKVAAPADPQIYSAVASGETLQSVHFDFVTSDNFVWQKIDLAGVRISRVEQAVAPPEDVPGSLILEEVTMVPVNTATVTLTALVRNPDGSGGPSIVSTITCAK